MQGLAVLPVRQGRVEVGGPHPGLYQCAHLIFHQRDQRADHNGDAGQQQGRQLVADRFAGARGHNAHRVATGKQLVNNGLLAGAKPRIAKYFL
ncbi:hypothetical protein SDC9_203225 [bioreactor metagenome]|uniref:Uncharacterized protein n=1 Tax=bioreactor metagenome TaxID=1076179 RepID=A0A645IW25_9ZZZZ